MSKLYLKSKREHKDKLRAAKIYKRTFKGTCGAMSYKDLARRMHATRPPGDKE